MSLVITALGVLIAAFGVPALFVQMRLQLQQRKLELGNFYIQRYWEIDDAMLTAPPKRTDSHRHKPHRYLRLCEDEYDAASYGWLDPMHWKIGTSGSRLPRVPRLLRTTWRFVIQGPRAFSRFAPAWLKFVLKGDLTRFAALRRRQQFTLFHKLVLVNYAS
jgi:hypothetical protein